MTSTLSVDVPGMILGKDEFVLKNWEENEGPIVDAMRRSGLFVDTGEKVSVLNHKTEIWGIVAETKK